MGKERTIAVFRPGRGGCDQPFKEGNPGAIGILTEIGDKWSMDFPKDSTIEIIEGQNKPVYVTLTKTVEELDPSRENIKVSSLPLAQ